MRRIIALAVALGALVAMPAVAGAAPGDERRAERFVRDTIESFAPRRYDVDWVRADCGRRDRCDFTARLTNDDRWGRWDDDRRGGDDWRDEGRRRNRDDVFCSGVVNVRGGPFYERVRCD
jgi:hypothetical protein